MIRICPERDGACPHGMDCPYTIDRYRCNEKRDAAVVSAPAENEPLSEPIDEPALEAAKAVSLNQRVHGDITDTRAVIEAYLAALPTQVSEPTSFNYRNYKGEVSTRTVSDLRAWFGSTEWHPEPQWLISAFDHDKNARRDFALADINVTQVTGWQPIETAPRDGENLLVCWPLEFHCPIVAHWNTGKWDAGEIGWKISGQSKLRKSNPTHWRPLPKTPLTAALGVSDA